MESSLEIAAREAALEDGIDLPASSNLPTASMSTPGISNVGLNASSARANLVDPSKQDVRRGKWTDEEEAYANR